MTAAKLVPLLLQASIFLIVFSLGLRATLSDALYLFRRPRRLLRAIVAMQLVTPLFAAALAAALSLTPAVEIALVALAVSPVPPLLPGKQYKVGGATPYVLGLLVAISALSIVVVPAVLGLLGVLLSRPVRVPVGVIFAVLAKSIYLPLALGVVVQRFAPSLAGRLASGISTVAGLVLLVAVVAVLVAAWPALGLLVGNGTLLAIAATNVFALATGHLLGGPDPDERGVLALATAARHPGIAMAIAGANVPGERLVGPAVLLYLIVNALVTIPYVRWRQRLHAELAGTSGRART